MEFTAFDYSNPPADGLYWIAFHKVVWDTDADEYGQTIGCPTGELRPSVAMVMIERIRDADAFPIALLRVDPDLGDVDECDTIKAYAQVIPPLHPDDPNATAVASAWLPNGADATAVTGFCWVAYTKASGAHGAALAYAEAVEGGMVEFAPLGNDAWCAQGFEEGDTVSHFIPLSIPSFPENALTGRSAEPNPLTWSDA